MTTTTGDDDQPTAVANDMDATTVVADSRRTAAAEQHSATPTTIVPDVDQHEAHSWRGRPKLRRRRLPIVLAKRYEYEVFEKRDSMGKRKIFITLCVLAIAAQWGCAANGSGPQPEHAPIVLTHIPGSENVPMFDLSKYPDTAYYTFVHDDLTPEMKRAAVPQGKHDYEGDLENGKGVGVTLDTKNANFHVDFPVFKQGGRSYGWTTGLPIGDWSDKLYLDNLAKIILDSASNDAELGGFYESLIQILGECNTSGLQSLKSLTQLQASNFLAIYTAEQYRRFMGTKDWDDAILEVTMLGAFHGGQDKFALYYNGKFVTQTYVQDEGVYQTGKSADGKIVQTKPASMDDYWQFSRDQEDSGIHETDKDYILMGTKITAYESAQKNPALSAVQAIVDPNGANRSVFNAIGQWFVNNEAVPAKVDQLAKDVSEFLVQVRKDAPAITKSLSSS